MTDEDKNLELIEEYINGFGWAVDTPDLVKTVVSANIRAFYHWSKDHLINERGDRLEAMIDRMAETMVDLRMALFDRAKTAHDVYLIAGSYGHATTHKEGKFENCSSPPCIEILRLLKGQKSNE